MGARKNQPAARPQAQAASGEPLKGYPMIEGLLDKENFNEVNRSFADAYGRLEKRLSDKALGLAGKKKVRTAMRSYELTVELIRELLALKYQMMNQSTAATTPAAVPESARK